MRWQSKKRRRLMAGCETAREEFVTEFGYCFGCGNVLDLCVHEMSRGTHREASLTKRFTWMVACSYCNANRFTDYYYYPLERQLALKWIHDRKYFDLEAFNVLRGRAPDAITMAEVIPHICREVDRGES